MKKYGSGAITCLLLCSGLATAAPPKNQPSETLQDVRACMEKNFVNRGSLRDFQIVTSDRTGGNRTLKLKLHWKPVADGKARFNLRVTKPAELEGATYLLLDSADGEEAYMYIPATKSARKISGQSMSQPVWGTDFSYAEIKQLQGLMVEGKTRRKADTVVANRKAYVLETDTDLESTGYDKVISYVDRDTCVLLKGEFFSSKGTGPTKIVEADLSSLIQTNVYTHDLWMVLGYTMRDLRRGTQSVLTMSDIYLLEQVPNRLFDPATFYETGE